MASGSTAAIKPGDAKIWLGVAAVGAAAVAKVAEAAIDTYTKGKTAKQDPIHKRAKMDKSLFAARKYRLQAVQSPTDSKSRQKNAVKASKHIDSALYYATQLDAEKELAIILPLKDAIDKILQEGGLT